MSYKPTPFQSRMQSVDSCPRRTMCGVSLRSPSLYNVPKGHCPLSPALATGPAPLTTGSLGVKHQVTYLPLATNSLSKGGGPQEHEVRYQTHSVLKRTRPTINLLCPEITRPTISPQRPDGTRPTVNPLCPKKNQTHYEPIMSPENKTHCQPTVSQKVSPKNKAYYQPTASQKNKAHCQPTVSQKGKAHY